VEAARNSELHNATKIPMIAITTNNSTRVKPRHFQNVRFMAHLAQVPSDATWLAGSTASA
jgi:hypothetical protein